jgi:hypothetical protein
MKAARWSVHGGRAHSRARTRNVVSCSKSTASFSAFLPQHIIRRQQLYILSTMFSSELLAATFLDPPDTIPDLNSWDFLTDLDTGHETLSAADQSGHVSVAPQIIQSSSGTNADAPALSSQSTQGLTALERKQEKNRLAQKRFRQRKKVWLQEWPLRRCM